MYELKTKVNDASVLDFLNGVENKKRKEDSLVILDVMSELTGEEPKMWGKSIVGFGSYHYQGKVQEGEWMRIGFSPRKASLTLYLMNGYEESEVLLGKLGKHKLGKSCLYINKLEDVKMDVLKELILESLSWMGEHYPQK